MWFSELFILIIFCCNKTHQVSYSMYIASGAIIGIIKAKLHLKILNSLVFFSSCEYRQFTQWFSVSTSIQKLQNQEKTLISPLTYTCFFWINTIIICPIHSNYSIKYTVTSFNIQTMLHAGCSPTNSTNGNHIRSRVCKMQRKETKPCFFQMLTSDFDSKHHQGPNTLNTVSVHTVNLQFTVRGAAPGFYFT